MGSLASILCVILFMIKTQGSKSKALFTEISTCHSIWNDTLHIRRLNNAGLILGLRQANERRRYCVTTPLIGWAQA